MWLDTFGQQSQDLVLSHVQKHEKASKSRRLEECRMCTGRGTVWKRSVRDKDSLQPSSQHKHSISIKMRPLFFQPRRVGGKCQHDQALQGAVAESRVAAHLHWCLLCLQGCRHILGLGRELNCIFLMGWLMIVIVVSAGMGSLWRWSMDKLFRIWRAADPFVI